MKRGTILTAVLAALAIAGSTFAGNGGVNAVLAHKSLRPEDGPTTCYVCHEDASREMFDRLQIAQRGSKRAANAGCGEEEEEAEKAFKGLETFCAYAPYSKGACYNCHVKTAGSSPNPPTIADVDCLICHH